MLTRLRRFFLFPWLADLFRVWRTAATHPRPGTLSLAGETRLCVGVRFGKVSGSLCVLARLLLFDLFLFLCFWSPKYRIGPHRTRAVVLIHLQQRHVRAKCPSGRVCGGATCSSLRFACSFAPVFAVHVLVRVWVRNFVFIVLLVLVLRLFFLSANRRRASARLGKAQQIGGAAGEQQRL